MRSAVKNRIHAVLHRHGLIHGCSDLFGTAGRRYLSLLITADDARLPKSGKQTLKGHLQLLDQLRRQIATVTRVFRKQMLGLSAGMRLRSLPGICWILGYTINAEIGDIKRFRSPKRLCSYSLLAPRANDSGLEPDDEETPKGRHVGHMGRRTLKWAWIEAAHGAVRKGGRFRAIFDRYTDEGKRNRNRGYIVVAHELCRIAYVLLKKEIDYDGSALPARPGSKKKPVKKKPVKKKARKMLPSSTSRPGTGQPQHPMVAAVV